MPGRRGGGRTMNGRAIIGRRWQRSAMRAVGPRVPRNACAHGSPSWPGLRRWAALWPDSWPYSRCAWLASNSGAPQSVQRHRRAERRLGAAMLSPRAWRRISQRSEQRGKSVRDKLIIGCSVAGDAHGTIDLAAPDDDRPTSEGDGAAHDLAHQWVVSRAPRALRSLVQLGRVRRIPGGKPEERPARARLHRIVQLRGRKRLGRAVAEAVGGERLGGGDLAAQQPLAEQIRAGVGYSADNAGTVHDHRPVG